MMSLRERIIDVSTFILLSASIPLSFFVIMGLIVNFTVYFITYVGNFIAIILNIFIGEYWGSVIGLFGAMFLMFLTVGVTWSYIRDRINGE